MRYLRGPVASTVTTQPRPTIDGADASWEDAPVLRLPTPEDAITRLLRDASGLVLKYPVTAQSIFSGLVAEGRRFAASPEGQAWRDVLAGSEFVRRGRAVWEDSVLNMLEDRPETMLPTAIFDTLVQAMGRTDLPRRLRELLRQELADGGT